MTKGTVPFVIFRVRQRPLAYPICLVRFGCVCANGTSEEALIVGTRWVACFTRGVSHRGRKAGGATRRPGCFQNSGCCAAGSDSRSHWSNKGRTARFAGGFSLRRCASAKRACLRPPSTCRSPCAREPCPRAARYARSPARRAALRYIRYAPGTSECSPLQRVVA